MVNFLTLNGSMREDLGSGNAGRIRKTGNIPGVIYGASINENIYISVSKKEFDKEYLKHDIQIKPIELNLGSKKYKVLTYQIDLDPITDLPRHIDFINIEGKPTVKTYIPVNFMGKEKSPGIKKGGFLNILKRKIQCFVDPLNIPQEIFIDISKMHIGEKLKINDLELPENIKLTDKSNFNVCTITGRGKSTTDDATATVAATTAVAGSPAVPAASASTAKGGDKK